MIEIHNLYKSYQGISVLNGITAQVKKGEVVALLGPSGSGKSTLLRCLNMLEKPSSGDILINNQNIAKKGYDLRSVRQKISMVFQHFNLFPHMTVLENLTYAPVKVLNIPKQQAEKNAKNLLLRVGMADKSQSKPAHLSGGQKQRVAIARALAMDPEVILFDEPTSALDPEMVKEVLNVIQDLAAQHTMTLIIVTHEMNFAKHAANTIWFLDQGRIVETSSPDDFFTSPQTDRASQFLKNVL